MKWLTAVIISILCSIPIIIISKWSLKHFEGDATASWFFTILSVSGVVFIAIAAFSKWRK